MFFPEPVVPSSCPGMATPGDLHGPALPGSVPQLSPRWMDDLGRAADSNFIRVSSCPPHRKGLVYLGARRHCSDVCQVFK